MINSTSLAQSILEEDCPYEDLTTVGLGIAERGVSGTVRMQFKTPGIVAGSRLAAEIFAALGLKPELHAAEGDFWEAQKPILTVSGSASLLHAAYKTAQCVMEYASGIAERTNLMLNAARSANPHVLVAGTRKHFPGGKRIALAGLLAGGGVVHRLGLSDSILVFDQHRVFTEDFPAALSRLKRLNPEKKVAVEADSFEEALGFVNLGADIIQCERFSPETLEAFVRKVKSEHPGVVVSAAGGVNAENAALYAAAGADILVTSWPYWGRPKDVKMAFSSGI